MKKIFQTVVILIFVYNILAFLIGLLSGSSSSDIYEQPEIVCVDYMNTFDSLEIRQHERAWYSRSVGDFCMGYQSANSINLQEGGKREGLIYRIEDYENFWGEVYKELRDQSQGVVNFLTDSLNNVADKKSLNGVEKASMVVSFVQDIPYAYVLAEDCSERETNGKPCLGNIPLGIVSPYEFIHSLYGDCDTRSVLIYVILEQMGYDPMIVVSDEYAHAMLALNIPSQGDYIKYAGKKYYFWETTAEGWGIGMLPPDSNNKDYWKKALVSNRSEFKNYE